MIKKENTKLTFILPKSIYNELSAIAEYEGRSLSNLILFIVNEYLKERKSRS